MCRGGTVLVLVALGAKLLSGGLVAAGDDADVPTQIWDFGYVPQKSKVNHVFYLHNSGNAPLSVDKIKAGCSCTSVSEIDKPIAPGDSAAVAITFKSGRYYGTVKKTSKVFAKDQDKPIQHFRIVANVIKDDETAGDLRLTPPKIEWKMKDAVVGIDADTLSIANAGDDSLEVSIVHVSSDVVDQIELPQDPKLGGQWRMVLRPSKEPIPDEVEGPSITLMFAGSDTTTVTVPIELKD